MIVVQVSIIVVVEECNRFVGVQLFHSDYKTHNAASSLVRQAPMGGESELVEQDQTMYPPKLRRSTCTKCAGILRDQLSMLGIRCLLLLGILVRALRRR